jgi:hypothetical protein
MAMVGLQPRDVTIAELLKPLGYATGVHRALLGPGCCISHGTVSGYLDCHGQWQHICIISLTFYA